MVFLEKLWEIGQLVGGTISRTTERNLGYMSYSLNSLKEVAYGDYKFIRGSFIGVIKGDTRSLDCSPYVRSEDTFLLRDRAV